jgi:hypothetical protein
MDTQSILTSKKKISKLVLNRLINSKRGYDTNSSNGKNVDKWTLMTRE